jgi:acylphosphatase
VIFAVARDYSLPVFFKKILTQSNPILTIMKRITAVAKGRVQGVGYRYFVQGCAHKAGVSGNVRNMPDGSVQIVAEGRRDALDAFVQMIRAEGEPVIRVDDLAITPGEATGECKGFWVEW